MKLLPNSCPPEMFGISLMKMPLFDGYSILVDVSLVFVVLLMAVRVRGKAPECKPF